MSASFGDCKNTNNGKHNGYDCPVPTVVTPPVTNNNGGDGGTVVTTPDPGPIYIS